MVSPPKPWERPGSVAATASVPPAPSSSAPSVVSDTTAVTPPSVPTRPASLSTTSPYTSLASTYSSPYSSNYSSPYSRFGSYSSPYSSYGGFGGGMYGGMGGMGYGGMGYGAYGGMGYGGMGFGGMPPQDPNNPSLTQQLESTTHQTFALLQSIVQTFGGFAQMLESTFMATHSSFFAMVGVAEQFGQLRNVLGQVLGLFGLLRWVKGLITGQSTRESDALRQEFRAFAKGVPPADPNRPKPSKKPILIFLAAIIGIPYLMHRLIRSLSSRIPPRQIQIDPSQLTFARAVHPFATTDPIELALKKDEIVAIMGTADPATGVEGEWWRGRTRDGREGWFPKAFVEVIKRPTVEPGPLQPTKVVE